VSAIAPDDYAAGFRFDLEADDKLRPRSLQSDDGKIGISEIGWCREATRRAILRTPKTDSPPQWAAMVGTYIDEGVERAIGAAHPEWTLKPKVVVALPLPDGSTVTIPGTGDIADPTEPSYTDVKTKDGLAVARRTWGDDERYRMQRHLVYAGLVAEHGYPTDGVVRNIVLDRSGQDPHPFVWQEPYDPSVVNQAGEWMGDVLYAVAHGEEASKDVAGHLCERCPWFTACRGSDIVKGPITNQRLADAVNEYGVADLEEKEAKRVKSELRDTVLNVNGWTDDFEITTTKVNSANGSARVLVKPR
jgi:hypothetical protein